MSKGVTITAVHLASVGDELWVKIEHNGEWITVIITDAICDLGHKLLPISHICEESGLRKALRAALTDGGH